MPRRQINYQRLERLSEKLIRAVQDFARAVSQEFPVGTPVECDWGKDGTLSGTVAYEVSSAQPARIPIKTKSGKVFLRSYLTVRITE